jgi:type I restriction enzyme S subunit
MTAHAAGLPGLPDGWEWTSLGESTHIVLGQSPPSSTYNREGKGLPFYQGKAEFGDTYPTPEKWCTRPKKTAEKGDVLISVRAPVGPTNICPEKSCIGRGLAAIRGLGGVSPSFLLYLLRSLEDDIVAKGTGTTFKAITGSQLKDIDMPLPPLAEQQRMVAKIEELLSQLDAGVAALEKSKTLLQRYRQAVLRAAMSGELRREWREAHKDELEPASKLLATSAPTVADGFKHPVVKPRPLDWSKLPVLPEGWLWTNVGEIGKVSGGLTKNPKRRQYAERVPYIRVANVYADELRLDDVRTIGVKKPELDRVLLKKGDLLIVEGNGSLDQIGRVARWDGSIPVCVHQNHVIKVRIDSPEIGEFVLHWLLSDQGRAQITRAASSTSGLYTLSLSKVRALPVPLPPLAEARHIVAEIRLALFHADRMEQEVGQGLAGSALLRQSILKRAFEGRLVPQDLTEEPASVLLERIQAEKARREAATDRRGKQRKRKEPDEPTLFS